MARKITKQVRLDLMDYIKYKNRGAYHWLKFVFLKPYRKYVDRFVDIFEDIESKDKENTIIDIGCGDGIFTYYLFKKKYNICGVDINPDAIRLAQTINVQNVSVKDIYDIKKTYQVGLLIDVFEHLIYPEKAVEKLSEIIQNRIYLVYPTKDSPHHMETFNLKRITEIFSGSPWGIEELEDFNYVDKKLIIFRRKN